LQLFDFIEADFGIFIVFEFFLMTAEYAEFGVFFDQKPLPLRPEPVLSDVEGRLRRACYILDQLACPQQEYSPSAATLRQTWTIPPSLDSHRKQEGGRGRLARGGNQWQQANGF
jgi:hypothetical protein